MFKIYRASYMVCGLVIVQPGINGDPDKYWDVNQSQWVDSYSPDTLRVFARDSQEIRNPDYRGQSVELTGEILYPGVIGKVYSVDNNGKKLELIEILTRSDLIRMAGITV